MPILIERNKKLVSDKELNSAIKMFNENTDISSEGLSYKRLDIDDIYTILPDAFNVFPDLGQSENIQLFRTTLIECRRNNELTVEAIIDRATSVLEKKLARPQITYTIWTKFRADGMSYHNGFSLNFNDVRVRSFSKLPRWLALDNYFMNGIGDIFPNEPKSFGFVVADYNGRVERHSLEHIFESINLIYSLFNIYCTWGSFRIGGGSKRADGRLWLGPYQFVFEGRKFRGDHQLWFNRDYDESTWTRFPLKMDQILKAVPFVRKVLKFLSLSPIKDLLVRSLLLMQSGFVSHDSRYCLLRYWSALEQLYSEGGARNTPTNKIIERALFAESDRSVSRWKLGHISRLRNDYVHSGEKSDDVYQMNQFLRDLLSRHIIYFILNGSFIKSQADLLYFVDAGSDVSNLSRKRALIDTRLKMLEKTSN